jgi:hypothetical protein
MTEAEWSACAEPVPVLEYLRGRAPDRKLRLFACACYSRLSGLGSNSVADSAIEVVERFAESRTEADELDRIAKAVSAAWGEFDTRANLIGLAALAMARHATHPDAWRAARRILGSARFTIATTAFQAADNSTAAYDQAERDEKAAQTTLLRDIFGNPFRPVAFSPSWRTDTAVSLARTMYVSRDFSAMPILADALQDAGCDSDDILDHCRGPGPHVRGCWVVDLVLGKE